MRDGRTFSYVLHEGGSGVGDEPGSPRLAVTQNDVRAIQLAKAALYAGLGCSWTTSGSRRSTGSSWPARSAARSIRSTR